MLVLTRRTREIIRIGDDTRITILGVKGNQVRLGIKAPLEVLANRKEIYQRIQNEFISVKKFGKEKKLTKVNKEL